MNKACNVELKHMNEGGKISIRYDTISVTQNAEKCCLDALFKVTNEFKNTM